MRILAVVLAAVSLGSCVGGPLEHSGYHDPHGSSKLTILGAPDSLLAVNEEVTLTATTTGGFPTFGGATGPTFQIIGGSQLVMQMGSGVYRVSTLASLLPSLVTIRAHVQPYSLHPLDTVRIWVRQRPVTLDLGCTPTPQCTTLVAGGASTVLFFSSVDANAYAVNMPTGTYRWGSIVSRSPLIAEVVDRPTGSSVQVRGLVAGTAWIVMTADGLADSVQVTVVP